MCVRTQIYLLSLTFSYVQIPFPATCSWLTSDLERWKHCVIVLLPCSEVGKEASLNISNLPNTQSWKSKPTLHYRMPSACELSPWLTESTSTAGNPSPTFWLYHVHSTQHWRHLLLFLFLPGVVLLLCLCHNHLSTLWPGFFRKPSFNIFQPMMQFSLNFQIIYCSYHPTYYKIPLVIKQTISFKTAG